MKLLYENKDISLHDLGWGKNFLEMTSKAHTTKRNIDKLGLIQTKKFGASKGAKIQPTKRQNCPCKSYISQGNYH